MLLDCINRNLFRPMLASPESTRANRCRIWTDKMRMDRLPVASIARYVQNAAASDTPQRQAANEEIQCAGHLNYRQLLPILRENFPDLWH